MNEVKAAFKEYCKAVEHSGLSFWSQAVYVDRANDFLRWLEYAFEPGSRLSAFPSKRKDAPTDST
jgi:hypothetical protein